MIHIINFPKYYIKLKKTISILKYLHTSEFYNKKIYRTPFKIPFISNSHHRHYNEIHLRHNNYIKIKKIEKIKPSKATSIIPPHATPSTA